MKKILSGSLLTSAMFLAACGGGDVSVTNNGDTGEKPGGELSCEDTNTCPPPPVEKTIVYFFSPEEEPFINGEYENGDRIFSRPKGVGMDPLALDDMLDETDLARAGFPDELIESFQANPDAYYFYEFSESMSEKGIDAVAFSWGDESTDLLSLRQINANDSQTPVYFHTVAGPASDEIKAAISCIIIVSADDTATCSASGPVVTVPEEPEVSEATVYFLSEAGNPKVTGYDDDGDKIETAAMESAEPKGDNWYSYTFEELENGLGKVTFTDDSGETYEDINVRVQGGEFSWQPPEDGDWPITVYLKSESSDNEISVNDANSEDMEKDGSGWYSYELSSNDRDNNGQISVSFEIDGVTAETSFSSANDSDNEFYFAAYPVQINEEYSYKAAEVIFYNGDSELDDTLELVADDSGSGEWSGAFLHAGDSKSSATLNISHISIDYTNGAMKKRHSGKAVYDATEEYELLSIYVMNTQGWDSIWAYKKEGEDYLKNSWETKPGLHSGDGELYYTFLSIGSIQNQVSNIIFHESGTSGNNQNESPRLTFSDLRKTDDAGVEYYKFEKAINPLQWNWPDPNASWGPAQITNDPEEEFTDPVYCTISDVNSAGEDDPCFDGGPTTVKIPAESDGWTNNVPNQQVGIAPAVHATGGNVSYELINDSTGGLFEVKGDGEVWFKGCTGKQGGSHKCQGDQKVELKASSAESDDAFAHDIYKWFYIKIN